MSNFVAGHLEEMADIRATRKRKLVSLCSVISLITLVGYGVVHFYNQDYSLAIINLICTVIVTTNLWRLKRHQGLQYTDILLSGVLMFQGLLLLLYHAHYPERLVWLFPLMVSVIAINEFKIGLVCSSLFCLMALAANIFQQSQTELHSVQTGFLFGLIVLCIICNTAAYYYAKLLRYIQLLYREGIEDLAYLDQLTGLANRWSFESWAQKKLSEVGNLSTTTALVFLDIDDFKQVNDTYGHDVGDRVLQNFARRLKNNVRSRDRKSNHHDYSIARFAGDEFVILLYDVRSKKDLDGILKRISHLFHDSYADTNKIRDLTVSVGVALYPQDADNLSELTRCADKAMYAAKHCGKNQFKYYSGDILTTLTEIPMDCNVHNIAQKSSRHIHKPEQHDKRNG
ncbi:diguanylate cyclase [Vibrio panuliri]|uniref:Diguanylate cyclase n=1 Tax=Vibrio panuliri TaxID=1381081 RepID=A0A1Q9HNA0_9VIBR|nr:GGDEF domain-containing protein [Vibrio panuliri]OLQ92284.1 diguanylate cyclase [Vibrio panuliri]